MNCHSHIPGETPRAPEIHSSGFSLIELLVSLVVASIVISIIASVMNSTAASYSKKKNTADISTIGYDAMLILFREIANTGLKTCLYTNGDGEVVDTLIKKVSIDSNTDSSSFSPTPRLPGDSLRLLSITLDDNGFLSAFRDISIYCDSGKHLIHKNNGDNTTYILCKHVEALHFEFQSPDGAWKADPTISEKNTVQSLRIWALIRSRNEDRPDHSTTFNLGGQPFSFSDGYTRKLFSQTIPLINNGKFPG